MKHIVFRLFFIVILTFCCTIKAKGQLTARNADDDRVTSYINMKGDNVFVFNQIGTNCSLSLEQSESSDFRWYRFNSDNQDFEQQHFFETLNNTVTSRNNLDVGGYMITVADHGYETPHDTFVAWLYRDTIFVFNEKKTGSLSLKQPDLCTFNWYRFDYGIPNFEEQPFFTRENVEETAIDGLSEGGYKVTVTAQGEPAPRDSFVAWLYLNPGFDFNLKKDDNGELLYSYKNCSYTDFSLSPNIVQSTFKYYNPDRLQQGVFTFTNEITYKMRREDSDTEIVTRLNQQGNAQYMREYDPPYKDTKYFFRANDMFDVERKDEVMYMTIIPYAEIDTLLPRPQPTSAPVPVKFTCTPYNVSEYLWRFGDGDSVIYNLEKLAPDTVNHTYYTPKKQGYQVRLKVVSLNFCEYTTEPLVIQVDDPLLDVANVFTPNNDGNNDYFKPFSISLRGFEIWIYTRTGKRVYYYKGDDLRDWKGWDGRIENSGKDAPVGIYIYTIRAFGWDTPPTRNPLTGPYSGSFHLYR